MKLPWLKREKSETEEPADGSPGMRDPQVLVVLRYEGSPGMRGPQVLGVPRYEGQRRAHSLSGCANLDSTPVLLGGTGVYHQPQSHYCSWSWN